MQDRLPDPTQATENDGTIHEGIETASPASMGAQEMTNQISILSLDDNLVKSLP